MRIGRPALVAAALLALALSACAGSREGKGPEEIAQRPMELALPPIRSAVVIEMATGVGGYKRVWTQAAQHRADRKIVEARTEGKKDWSEVLDWATREAGVVWEWRRLDDEWVVWLHLPGEEWSPES